MSSVTVVEHKESWFAVFVEKINTSTNDDEDLASSHAMRNAYTHLALVWITPRKTVVARDKVFVQPALDNAIAYLG